MNKMIFSKLPLDIIINILLYDKRFIIRDKKIFVVSKISKNDIRYKILFNKIFIFIYKNNNHNKKIKFIPNTIVITEKNNDILNNTILNNINFSLYLYNTILLYKNL